MNIIIMINSYKSIIKSLKQISQHVCVYVCVYGCVCVCVLTNNIAPTGAQVKHMNNSPTNTRNYMTNHITSHYIILHHITLHHNLPKQHTNYKLQ